MTNPTKICIMPNKDSTVNPIVILDPAALEAKFNKEESVRASPLASPVSTILQHLKRSMPRLQGQGMSIIIRDYIRSAAFVVHDASHS